MEQVIRYQCELCKKEFRTPNKHRCKKNPELKNCFSCKNFMSWDDNEGNSIPYPTCEVYDPEDEREWDLQQIKLVNYNMQCEKWEPEK